MKTGAERRKAQSNHCPHPHLHPPPHAGEDRGGGAAARSLGARPPSGASLYGSRWKLSPPAQLQARFPGTRVYRALSGVTCPSPVTAPHAPAVVPANMMPKAARERIAKPRAGAAPRSAISDRIRNAPVGERDSCCVTETGTNVKEKATSRYFAGVPLEDARLVATLRKRSSAVSRLSTISAAISSGGGSRSGSSNVSSFSQKMSRLILSRLIKSA